MVLKKIIQRVQSLYSKGVQSNDSRLSSRHIYNKILTVRSKLLSEQSDKKQKVSDWNYQTLPCIELINVPAQQCPCIPPSGCEVVRSKHKLPRPLVGISSHLIKEVTSIEGTTRYSESSLSEKRYKKYSKYTSNKPDYFIQDGYLYLTHRTGTPRIVSMVGLFDNPLEAKEYQNYCNDCIDCEPCQSPLDYDLPIDGDMIELVIEMAAKELIDYFVTRGKEDVTSNSSDDGQQAK